MTVRKQHLIFSSETENVHADLIREGISVPRETSAAKREVIV
jgi:hypothetical protein